MLKALKFRATASVTMYPEGGNPLNPHSSSYNPSDLILQALERAKCEKAELNYTGGTWTSFATYNPTKKKATLQGGQGNCPEFKITFKDAKQSLATAAATIFYTQLPTKSTEKTPDISLEQ